MIFPIEYIFNLVKNFKKSLIILFIHPMVTAFFLIFPSFIIKNLTDAFLIIDKDIAIFVAIKWMIIYFIVVGLNFLYWRLYQYIIHIKLFPILRKNIVLDCVSYLIDNTKLFFNNHPAGEIAHFLIHLNENLIDFIILLSEKVMHNILGFIFILICFFYYNKYCALILTLWIIFIFLISVYIVSKINKLSSKIVISKSLITNCIIDIFNNISLVQVFCKQKNELNLLINKTDVLSYDESMVAWYYFKICCFYYTSFAAMEAISFYILLNQYRIGLISASDIVFWWMLSGISVMLADNLINDILRVLKYYSGIQEGLNVLKSEIKVIKNKKFIFKEGKIEFRNVYFSFKDKVILEDFSLIINPNEKIAIVGFSGSGKTTLIFLILRMYTPDSGSIYIDGQDIKYVDKELLYKIFSVILQENNILDRSILENIIYGNNDCVIDKDRLRDSIQLSCLDEFKEDIENSLCNSGISSKVLSGGQKQRISIARALYKEANIFLLDEPTSSLDPITEDNIINSIKKATLNKTMIIITHKLNIITWVPRILVFEKGKIIEEGSHKDLIKKNGLYNKLYNLDEII